jgi:hypothetical protein
MTNITTTTNGITIVRIPTSPQLEVIVDEQTGGAVDEHPLTAPLESIAKEEQEEMTMNRNAKRKILEQILAGLMEEQGVGGLPEVSSPQTNLRRREQERQGFFAWLTSRFDPVRRLEYDHEQKRLVTELEAGTDLQKIKAETAIEKAKIHKSAIIADYQHKADQWLSAEALKNEGMATVVKYKQFRELVDFVSEQNFDPSLEERVIKELHGIYFGRDGKRNG